MVQLIMNKYSVKDIEDAKVLRLKGKTYSEISKELNKIIPKSTFSYWFKGLVLSPDVQDMLSAKITKKLMVSRVKAVEANKEIRNKFRFSINEVNLPLSKRIIDPAIAKIALAMLCLGEASKSTSSSGFYLGNSDQRIIVLFMKLLIKCFPIDESKFRFTIQCRADQDIEKLERYWRKVIGVADGQFYKPRIDPRTIGKPTKNLDYKGVLRVDYIDKKIQLELESLANLLYNQAVSL